MGRGWLGEAVLYHVASAAPHAKMFSKYFEFCSPFPGKYMVSSLAAYAVPGMVNKHSKTVSGFSSDSDNILWTDTSYRPSLSTINVVVSTRSCLLKKQKISNWSTFSKLGQISWVTITIPKIFHILQYSSWDLTANNRFILVSSSRRIILIFVYLPQYWMSYLKTLKTYSCFGHFI